MDTKEQKRAKRREILQRMADIQDEIDAGLWTTVVSKRIRKPKVDRRRSGGGGGVNTGAPSPLATATCKMMLVIPHHQHGRIIGIGGSIIKSLQATTKTRIEIPNKDQQCDIVSVTGHDSESVDAAVQSIQQLLCCAAATTAQDMFTWPR